MARRDGKGLGAVAARPAAVLLGIALVAVAGVACGAADTSAVDKSKVKLTIGARSTPEERVLGQIYAQALRAAGYRAKAKIYPPTEYRTVPLDELREGRISGYPEHIDAALSDFFDVEDADLPSDPRRGFERAKERLEDEDLTAFPPTPYGLSRPITFLRATAEEHDLASISDLRGVSEKMRLLGFSDCHLSADCLGGIEQDYNIFFESISYMYSPAEIRRRYTALKEEEFDAIVTYSTDGRLAGKQSKFVALEDDRHAFQAGNVIFLTTKEVVNEAGPDFEQTIVTAQKGLTLPVMQKLDAEVEIEKRSPAGVAARYLRRVGLNDER